MLARSVFAIGSLALIAAATFQPRPAADNPVLLGAGLNNCDIDVRSDSSGEAQVYWKEYPAAHAVQYEIWDRYNDTLLAGNALAEDELQLKAPTQVASVVKTNTVVFEYDTVNNWVTLTILNSLGDVQKYEKVPAEGRYDPIGPFVEPVATVVRRDAAGKRRIRITAENFGIIYSFTLSDA